MKLFFFQGSTNFLCLGDNGYFHVFAKEPVNKLSHNVLYSMDTVKRSPICSQISTLFEVRYFYSVALLNMTKPY